MSTVSVWGVDHGDEIAKGITDSDGYKRAIWNHDVTGKSPAAKTNRKIVRRARLKGEAIGTGVGGAGGAGLGALAGLATRRPGSVKFGALVGGASGAIGGSMVGVDQGTKRAMANPNYTRRPPRN